ncbi:MAG: bifunctional precorrin-2 dehydrogenase/sirohydrochlorin ferrochelatase [Flavobacteriales bacterium]|nr:bifunctional precorrin-2 dehydrogenase/sirohydrochlorin ferrochelatase [Flavobacteriales bacterium]
MKTNDLYPIFLKLDQVQTLIVGAGNVGLEKVNFILRQSPNAKIKIVGDTFHPEIISKALNNKSIQIVERKFISQDLDKVKVLIVATKNEKLNTEIYHLAQSRNILTNVVDNPPLCDFYTAAVMKKGPVKIAVSSNGASPTLAKRLRDILEEVIPDEVEYTAEILEQIRTLLKGDLQEKIKTLNALTTVLSPKYNCNEKIVGREFLRRLT